MYIDEKKLFFLMIIVIVFLAALIGLFLYGLAQQYRLFSARQASFDRKRFQALEKERADIVSFLMDEVVQILLINGFVLKDAGQKSDKDKEYLEKVKQHTGELIRKIQKMSFLITPAMLSGESLMIHLWEYSRRKKEEQGIEIDINAVQLSGISEEQALHLYRMLGEMLDNAIEHSGASEMVISAEQNDSRIVVRAADNGRGFNLDKAREQCSLGLEDLEVRAKIIGAELMIETAEGKGTSYTINLPVRK